MRAAPTNRTTHSPSSATTSAERVLLWPKPLPERLLASLMTALRSERDVTSAGTSPKTIPVNIDRPSVNTTIFQSMPSREPPSPRRGSPAVFTPRSARMPKKPTTSPATPPASANTTLSVRS